MAIVDFKNNLILCTRKDEKFIILSDGRTWIVRNNEDEECPDEIPPELPELRFTAKNDE